MGSFACLPALQRCRSTGSEKASSYEIDANKNKKVNFREWKHWASGKLTKLAIDEEQAKAAGA